MARTQATLLAAACLAVASCDTVPALVGPAPFDPTPEAAHAYVALASSGDAYEIESGRLALQRSADPRHRSFAQMMVGDHGTTTVQLNAAATAAGLGPWPGGMLPVHQAMMRELAASANFDATYHQQQIRAHEMALALHSNYSARGDRAELRTYASMTAPVVQRHLDQMRGM